MSPKNTVLLGSFQIFSLDWSLANLIASFFVSKNERSRMLLARTALVMNIFICLENT